MNERIKELWENSDEIKVRYPEQGSPVSVSEQTLEKFAELIVRECAEQIKTHGISASSEDYGDYEIGFNAGLYHALYTIKQHFGVEE